ncbi:Peptidase M3A/M3B, thimet/oligopeptidase F [Penicillium camemberti]|uniref:Peptidase M3A/M3B, thimet/oligopeptidase F n=1 Tax=Penicillium camemberti (strain FM 013) TaxID=1429867 RepID=A0A0G4PN97_PENC3|nr:Peptidase M3A/M3B, thimet/oligopeptidase F [Penicillium camemberti]
MKTTTEHFVTQEPPIFNSTPQLLKEEAQKITNTTTSTWNLVVAGVQIVDASFENTIWPIIQDENAKFEKKRLLLFYASTYPAKDVRDASNEVSNMLTDTEVELFSRRDMFLLVDSVVTKTKHQESTHDDESHYYLQKLHQRFLQNGCGITGNALKNEFKAKMKRLNHLERDCNRNLHEETTGLWLTPNELEGLPDSILGRLKEGEGIQTGQLWLPTKVPFSGPAMKNVKKESTRKKIYYAVENRMVGSVPLFRELVLLRDDTARMLGYPNHFARKTSDKMVQGPQVVVDLLSEIREAVAPLATSDAEELLLLKQQEEAAFVETANRLFHWDVPYFTQRRIEWTETRESTVSEYFELHMTLQKLLQMFQHLLGVEVRRVDTAHREGLIWHEDVHMYTAWKVDGETDEFLGYAYLDLFPRDGKYSHSGHYPLQFGYQRPDGGRFYPSSALIMNYVKPLPDQPTLLSLDDVRKLFHELGHLFHALFTRIKYAGLCPVDRDFVEAPSKMLEQFFWVERHIKDISYHYSYISPSMMSAWMTSNGKSENQPPKPPPIQLDDKQAAALSRRNKNGNIRAQLNNLFFATYDMLIHSPTSREELLRTNLTELFNKTRSSISGIQGGEILGEGWEWGHGQTTFRNVINRYDAGYYSYLLGTVLAFDIFETGFRQDTMSKEAGRRYRDMILRVGGSQSEMKTLRDYLGREPTTRPYLEWLGAIPRHT